jgi:hypothetical protein
MRASGVLPAQRSIRIRSSHESGGRWRRCPARWLGVLIAMDVLAEFCHSMKQRIAGWAMPLLATAAATARPAQHWGGEGQQAPAAAAPKELCALGRAL